MIKVGLNEEMTASWSRYDVAPCDEFQLMVRELAVFVALFGG